MRSLKGHRHHDFGTRTYVVRRCRSHGPRVRLIQRFCRKSLYPGVVVVQVRHMRTGVVPEASSGSAGSCLGACSATRLHCTRVYSFRLVLKPAPNCACNARSAAPEGVTVRGRAAGIAHRPRAEQDDAVERVGVGFTGRPYWRAARAQVLPLFRFQN